MDGEKKTYPYGWEEPLVILLLVLFLLNLFSGIPRFFEEKTGVDTGPFSALFGDVPLDADTPIGTKTINVRSGLVYAGPGSDEVIGEVPRGAFGEVVGGPILVDGQLWWEIEYEDGTRGWVPGSDIEIDADRDKKALKAGTPRGTKVEATEDTTVYSSPGEDGIPIGTVDAGTKGTIIGGPVEIDGERWWQIKYEDGTVGWVPESSLEVDVQRNLKGLNDNTLIGTAVRGIADLDVFNFPRNGNIIGSHLQGTLGTLVGGPVTVSTSRWWDVDFDEGVDGWVDEESLERQFALTEVAEGAGSFFRKLSFIISALFGIGVIILFFKLRDEISREYHAFKPLAVMPNEHRAKNSKWDRVLEHIDSDNPNDWRLAILEADIMLEEMVDTMMLGGTTLGEKLKRVERADFKTIDKAWEAHKMRNNVAHQGGDYILTQREAKRIIALYKDVFDEFHFV